MKRIIFGAKIGLGIVIVLIAAYSLHPFEGAMDLIFGAVLMLAGVGLGFCLERHCGRIFTLLSLPAFLLTFSLYFFPALSIPQYFTGGFLIYFACAVIFSGKKTVKTI